MARKEALVLWMEGRHRSSDYSQPFQEVCYAGEQGRRVGGRSWKEYGTESFYCSQERHWSMLVC